MRLGAVVFVAGAATLAVEISASRLLAPFFGSSTIVWANVIGLILVYLSLGYWLGGRVADRRPQQALLGRIIVVAALAIVVIPFVARPFLDATVNDLNAASAGAVVGTFLSALVAIPLVGTQRTMLGTATLVVLAGATLLGARWQWVTVAVGALLLLPPGAVKAASGLLYEGESQYQYIDVRRQDDGSRVLELNEGVVANSIWYPHSVLTGGEWDMFLLVPPLVPHPVRRVLVLG